MSLLITSQLLCIAGCYIAAVCLVWDACLNMPNSRQCTYFTKDVSGLHMYGCGLQAKCITTNVLCLSCVCPLLPFGNALIAHVGFVCIASFM